MLDSNDQIFRRPLGQFLKRYPFESLQYLIKAVKDLYTFKFFLYLMKTEQAFLNVFKNEPNRIINLLNGDLTMQQKPSNNDIIVSSSSTKPVREIQF